MNLSDKLKIPEEYRAYIGSALVVLGFTPQIFFALHMPEVAVAIQDFIGFVERVQPAWVQGLIIGAGGKLLKDAPKDVTEEGTISEEEIISEEDENR